MFADGEYLHDDIVMPSYIINAFVSKTIFRLFLYIFYFRSHQNAYIIMGS